MIKQQPGRSRTRRRWRRPTWPFSVVVLCLCCTAVFVCALRPAGLARITARDYGRMQDVSQMSALQDPRPYLNYKNASSLLANILVPRVPGSPENAKVRAALLAPFQGRASWTIDEHKFVASTPEGEKQMTNLILTYNANAPRRLVLAAHHDSKVSPKGFVGATDSAVPCAIIVDTALALEKALDRQGATKHARAQETGLQLIFFDGEEAYVQWTQSDSVYGSRALASSWVKSFFSPQQDIAKRRTTPGYSTMRTIDAIEHFVLLDLLGTPHPVVPSYFTNTHWMHDELRSAEERLAMAGVLFPKDERGALELPPAGGARTPVLHAGPGLSERRSSFFPDSPARFGGIDDDHRPFLHNGVPILHLIPSPFPAVWHRMSDDASSLDWPTIHAWAMIMRVFVAEYFGVQDTAKALFGRHGDDFR